MGNIDQVEANNVLSASVTGSPYRKPVRPIKLALMTVNGTATANGTEVTNSGGSTYARQDTTTSNIWGAPSGGSITNSGGSVSFTNMPAVASPGVQGIELWDSGSFRAVTDGVLNSTTTITSATAAFSASDVGAAVTGAGIPASTTIASVTNSTTAVLSAAATQTASNVLVGITQSTGSRRWFGPLAANKVINQGDTVTFNTSSLTISIT